MRDSFVDLDTFLAFRLRQMNSPLLDPAGGVMCDHLPVIFLKKVLPGQGIYFIKMIHFSIATSCIVFIGIETGATEWNH